ncbi:methylated-DNA--[protein]-cysteine S-methyltransferase [Psychrosphaera algicola]|uniref:Methylated-DNA--protein-cysteine methyltransferase n=1 Tax=Psychrosphaera algicola TaxID=3023714 RepID=A0ABT5FE51_9GAMM|nr:methylated-DNA--[protein]-cysteine S-methyltransferase [Psychrosphaera sp. G1-22]MDC2889831.1 methylated-DNA--[protein]-cysteine S-methyltransferase [Psychrosphaera sp. G1-22]
MKIDPYNKEQGTQLTRWLTTPLGPLEIRVVNFTSKPAVYKSIVFVKESDLVDVENSDEHPLLDLAFTQLTEYFAHRRTEFNDLLCHLSDFGTEFQRQVWQGLTQIPYGETCSYGDLAKVLNNPKAVRAVGAANGKNPLAVVVPCHRVIGANGTLTGYAGGLDKKQWLLIFEQQQIPLL